MKYMTDIDIENTARNIRRNLGMENSSPFDLMTAIVNLKEMYRNFNYLKVPDKQMPHAYAMFDSSKSQIIMRQSIFEGMQRRDPHACMTVAHELSHFLLSHGGIRNRSVQTASYERQISQIRKEEREASRLAAVLLAPEYLIDRSWSAEEISFKFGVSLTAATLRKEEIERIDRIKKGEKRKLPREVVDFLL